MPKPGLLSCGVAAAALCCGSAAGARAADPAFSLGQLAPDLSWTSAGNGLTNDHDASAEFILGRATLPYLSLRWAFTASGEVQSTPTVEKDAVYVSDSGGSVWRLDAVTGQPVWQARLPSLTGNPASYSRVSPAITPDAVIVGDQASGTVFALSKSDGALLWKTTIATNRGAIITSSPIASDGVIYVGVASNQETLADKVPGFVPDFRGSVAALDVRTGTVLWQTYVIPTGYTGGAVWSSTIAVDKARSAIYVTTGNNYSVPAAVAACQAKATTAAALDACLPADDHIDSIMSLDTGTGAIRWSDRFAHADTWTVSCSPSSQPPATPCPSPTGLDVDFGAGANLFTATINGAKTDLVGAGQKSGAYFAINRDTGRIAWGTQVSPDGPRGGIQWGTATDGTRLYVPSANSGYVSTTLQPSGSTTNGGFWSALDPATGRILWQTPTAAPAPTPASSSGSAPPAGALADAEGSVAGPNGVLYGEDAAGNFVALDAATGTVLRTVQSGGAAIAAPAISLGTLYWGSGYATIGATNNKLYAISPLSLP